MNDMNRLGGLILKHWTTHRPMLVEELKNTNQLQPALRQAQEQTGDLLHTLTVVQKMDYQAAWELATREWAFLPNEDRPERPPLKRLSSGKLTLSQTPSRPAISE